MEKYRSAISRIVSVHGGIRERAILNSPHTLEPETWNTDHKVINVISEEADPDGYRPGFQVDVETNSICG